MWDLGTCWSWWHCLLSEILDRIYEIIQINNHSNILVTLKERESSWRICHGFVIFKHCNNQMFKIVMHQRFSNHQFNSSKLELISHIYQRLLPIFHIIEASFCFHLKDIIIRGCKLKFTSWGPEQSWYLLGCWSLNEALDILHNFNTSS